MTLLQILLLFGCLAMSFFFLADAVLDFQGKKRDQRVGERLSGKAVVLPADQPVKKTENNPQGTFIERYLKNAIDSADSPLSLERLYLVIATLFVTLAALFYIYIPYVPFAAGLVISALLGFGAPIALLKRQSLKRNSRFEELFPDALDLIVRSLRIGQPLNAAIKAVADEMPDPIGKEFFLVSQAVAYGKDLPDAVEEMLRRISIQDLRFFVVAIQIQHESGGNLAEVLEGLSKIIRSRSHLKRKVGALTVEGRFSAWFLSVFPVVMIFVMSMVNPGYYRNVASFPYFNHLAAAVAIMLIVNVVAMRIMTKIKV